MNDFCKKSFNIKTMAAHRLKLNAICAALALPTAIQVTYEAQASEFALGSYTSVQVNVDKLGKNIIGDAGNETTIAVNPSNPANIVIGWRQFDAAPNSYVQAGWSYSTNGGSIWSPIGILPALPEQRRTDPVLDVNSQGHFYYQSLSHNVNGGTDLFRSIDGGRTWQEPVYMFQGDKNWLAVDRTGSTSEGNIYSVWRDPTDPKHFVRSTDKGNSFQQPDDALPVELGFGEISVGVEGEVYVVGRSEVPEPIVSGISFEPISFLKSVNAKDASVSPTFTIKDLSMGGAPVTYFGLNNPNPGGNLGDIQLDIDHSVGPLRGNIYALAALDPPGVDKMDIHFIRSSDGGETWSEPIRINDDPANKNNWQWFAMMSVAPNSRIDAVWYDTRNSGTHEISQLYYAYSWDGGVTWSQNQPVSPPFNSHLPKITLSDGSQQAKAKMGDYTHMVSDATGGHVAYAATYNGEHDVYYLNVFPDCNSNKLSDVLDISQRRTGDINTNNVPDSCENIIVLGDIDGDRDVDQLDVNQVIAARNKPASGASDPKDIDKNGVINGVDARKQTLLCTRPRCAV